MAVYFYKLFDKITELNITQKELMKRIGASSATLTKMRNNQTVSLDVIVRICDELKCDIGDVVSCVPKQTDVEAVSSKSDRLNELSRSVLTEYMRINELSSGEVARITSLSVNTVKAFLNGKNISPASQAKLSMLGEQYVQSLREAYEDFLAPKTKKRTYCNSCGKRKNRCWAAKTLWKADENKYEHYCAFGFEQSVDENQQLYAAGDCPHPTTGKEFVKASEKYEYSQKGEIEFIPAKGERK